MRSLVESELTQLRPLSNFQYLCPLNCKAAHIVNPCAICTAQARHTLSRGQVLPLLHSCLLGDLPHSFHLLYYHPWSLFCLPLVGDQYALAPPPYKKLSPSLAAREMWDSPYKFPLSQESKSCAACGPVPKSSYLILSIVKVIYHRNDGLVPATPS